MNDYDQLSSLDTTRTNWCVKVRVTRMWPSISTTGGYNLLLLDEENVHVHAFIYADNWTALSKKISIEEGSLYTITNFYTKAAFGSFRPVSSKILINFSNSTIVEKVDTDDFMIPMHKFEFVDLGDLFKLAESYGDQKTREFSTDVMGVFENCENLDRIDTVNGPRSIIRFRITDGRYSHKATAWGDLAERIDDERKKAVETPIIVILTGTKMNTHRNSVQLSTTSSSKAYMNLDIDAVIAMRQRLIEEGYTPRENDGQRFSQRHVSEAVQTLNLKQVAELAAADYIKKNVYCNIKVVRVEENRWWYDSCGGCENEVQNLEGKLYCDNCKKNIHVAEKRYRIVILGEDSTEAYNFVLLDRAAKRMIGTTATKLISDKFKDLTTNEFPPQIRSITEKELKLKIVIKEDNIASKSRLYFVVDACYASNSGSTISSSTDTQCTTSAVGDSSVVNLSESGDTPGTSKSTSKKVKLEK
ncbi:uncharacterized protein LOC108204139 [Daucus carota subsp. sativus]|uniref:uncharacterized protein LOC108204139 n=1 Tax=Daucus carota subsp. sativus TaxID=79200 RepID=UPI0030838EF1